LVGEPGYQGKKLLEKIIDYAKGNKSVKVESISPMHGRRRADHLEDRIAIIGGGVSGVTAAYKLHKKGCRNITLFEANDRLGGKVCTVDIDGQVIDVGAFLSLKDNSMMFDMGRDLGILAVRNERPKIMVLWTKPDGSREKVSIDRYWGGRSTLAVAQGLLQLGRIIISPKFRPLFKPGFHDLHPDLVNLTMTDFARKYKFDAVLDPCYVLIYFCGYGSLTDTAALYCLKFIRSLAMIKLRRQVSIGLNPGLYTFVGGFQRFWVKIGSHLAKNGVKLHLGSAATRVVRRTVENGRVEIAVTAKGETTLYDRLLVTCPPDQILKFLDATDEEKDLFGRVNYFNYHVIVIRAEGIKGNELVLFRDNMERHRHGHLLFYMSDWPGSNLFLSSQVDDGDKSDAELDVLVRQDIAELGGTVTEIVLRKPWSYFPHVRFDDLDQQYYPRLNALQGQKGTYYSGSIYAFEATSYCANYADFVVDNYLNGQAVFAVEE
jgi:protoporphyrinogen/coproporphyrinogen III oxidase